jgi:opacity protein-like surface antigen
MKHTYLVAAIVVVLASSANAADFEYQHLWTFSHTEANGSKSMGSEIVAYDATNYHLWVIGTDANEANAGKGGIDILDLSGQLVHSIDTQSLGGINSVAVKNNQAAVADHCTREDRPGFSAIL